MKFIDLFAGIGGMRLPFESLGGECVFTSEIDKFARQTYEANFTGEVAGDITKIKEEAIPGHDLLLAGFPCQSFSQAGLKRGFHDARGTMFFEVARILAYHKPKSFLLENVKGLKNHDGGQTLKVMLNILSNLGYKTHCKVLNAKDFGVPQNRERIFLVGTREATLSYSFPKPTNKLVKLGDILQHKVADKYTLSDKLWKGHQERKSKALSKGYGFGFSLFSESSPYTSAITARYYKDGAEILIAQQGKNPRRLTPREAARLQGFPGEFVIPVSNTQAYKQFGNSVAVPVIISIANSLVGLVNEKG
jgi:DNA (cytosine-5)-methyltransferase 1